MSAIDKQNELAEAFYKEVQQQTLERNTNMPYSYVKANDIWGSYIANQPEAAAELAKLQAVAEAAREVVNDWELYGNASIQVMSKLVATLDKVIKQ